jgi:hypothetical protein
MNILSGDFDDRFGSIPACRFQLWIVNLATCYVCLNGQVRPEVDVLFLHILRAYRSKCFSY